MAKLLNTLLIFLLSVGSAAADYPLEIIDLKGRPAKDIVPLVKPFAGPDGTVVGKDNKLIVRAAPDRMREIRKILAEIDQPPRRLMISVRRGYPQERTGQRFGYSTNRETGNDEHRAGERKGQSGPRRGVSIHASRLKYHTRRDQDVTQKVQTLEGSPAFINTGRSVPIHNYSAGRRARGSYTYYRDAVTGFYVVPRLNGDQITLAIHQRATTPSHDYPQHDMQFELQEAQTVVSGRLGEWITIAGVDSTAERDQRDGEVRASTLHKEDQTLQVLVEALP
jgi:hypothetical protein